MVASYRVKGKSNKYLVTIDYGVDPVTNNRKRAFRTVNTLEEAQRLVAEYNANLDMR